jgi:hypothetical protein
MYKIVKKRCNSVCFVEKQDIWKLKCIKDGIFDYKHCNEKPDYKTIK